MRTTLQIPNIAKSTVQSWSRPHPYGRGHDHFLRSGRSAQYDRGPSTCPDHQSRACIRGLGMNHGTVRHVLGDQAPAQ